jgi:4-hydroxy-tetrahydrodipicolinate synthase
MREGLTRQNLHGVWAAVPTPFDEWGHFDPGVLRENVRRLHTAGVHGVYTTDSDGEFYAIELDEFRRIADTLADESRRLGIPTQMGVTWCNTQGMLDRLRYAAHVGILGAHVGHPFFMPMTAASYRAFWDDVARSVPAGFALIHYNTPRVHNYQRASDYAVLQREIPGLVGTKHVGLDMAEFLDLVGLAPELSHFAHEQVMTPYMMFGARGVYSWFANINPRFMLDWYDEIRAGNWDKARQRQERMQVFIRAKDVLRGGNLHGIVNKAVGAAFPFLVETNRTRRPYLPVPVETIERFRRLVEEQCPDLIPVR